MSTYRPIFTALVLTLLCMATNVLKAQSVTGRIVDESLRPIPFVNVVMLEKNDSSFIVGTMTGEDGRFALSAKAGEIVIRLSCIGYKTMCMACPEVADAQILKALNLGDIKIHADELMLDEVVVKSRIPIHKMTVGGISTDVANTVLRKLGTAEEVLAKIPGIIRNGKAFEVFGRGEPLIYINRRQMRDMAELERLKAEDIKNIEVITSPDSRYAATVRSVIKIYTKKIHGEGLGIDVRSAYYQSENTDLSEQLNLRYQYGGLDIFGNFGYSLSNSDNRSSSDTHVVADTIWDQRFIQKVKTDNRRLNCVAGLSYAFNNMHSAGIKYSVSLNPRNRTNSTFYSDVMADGKYFDHIDNSSHAYGECRPTHILNMYYLGQLGKTEIDLNADYLSGTSREHSKYYELSADHEDRTVTTCNSKRNEMFASKLVISRPVYSGGLVVGAEYTHTSHNDDYINDEQYIPTSRSYIKERHIAAFVEYSRTLAKTARLSVGARYERVSFDYYENDVRIADQSRTFGNIFPNLSLGMPLGKVSLQLVYTTKTRRPDYWQLSNNVIYGNRFLLQSGNSMLKHEYVHDLSLTGLWKFLQLSLSYNDRRNAVITWAEQLEGNNAVSKFTYVNIPTLKSVTASMAMSHKIGIWTPQIMAGVTKQWLKLTADIGTYNMNVPSWQFSMGNILSLQHGWVITADSWLRTKGYSENFYSRKCVGALDIGITKWMMGERLSVQLKGTDVLRSLKTGYESYAGRIHTLQAASYDSREVMLKVIYRLNMSKSRYKGTGAGNEEKSRL